MHCFERACCSSNHHGDVAAVAAVRRMNWLAFAETVVTLFVIVDPLGTVPVFVALTAEQTPSQRRWTAVQSAAVAGSLIAVFALFGASCWPT